MSVDVRRDGRVALITVNRPEALNALSSAILEELHEELTAMKRDDDVGAIVLTGAGEKSFIAGADIHELATKTALAGPRVRGARAGGRAHARDDAQGDHRGRQRLRARRRLRDGAGLRHPARLRARGLRPARDQPRDHARLGRHAAARAHDVAGLRQGADPDRPQRAGPGGARARPGAGRAAAGGAAAEGAGDGARRSRRRAPSPSPTARTRPTARCTATSARTSCTRPTSSRSSSRRRTRRRAWAPSRRSARRTSSGAETRPRDRPAPAVCSRRARPVRGARRARGRHAGGDPAGLPGCGQTRAPRRLRAARRRGAHAPAQRRVPRARRREDPRRLRPRAHPAAGLGRRAQPLGPVGSGRRRALVAGAPCACWRCCSCWPGRSRPSRSCSCTRSACAATCRARWRRRRRWTSRSTSRRRRPASPSGGLRAFTRRRGGLRAVAGLRRPRGAPRRDAARRRAAGARWAREQRRAPAGGQAHGAAGRRLVGGARGGRRARRHAGGWSRGSALPWRGLGAELSRAAQGLSRRYDAFADTGKMPRAAPAPVVRAYQAVQRADELHARLADGLRAGARQQLTAARARRYAKYVSSCRYGGAQQQRKRSEWRAGGADLVPRARRDRDGVAGLDLGRLAVDLHHPACRRG